MAVSPNIPRGIDPWVAKLRREGYHYRATLLYNSLPRWVHDVKGTTVDGFKGQLNRYLAVVPDRPRDISGSIFLTLMIQLLKLPQTPCWWGG